MRSRQPSGDPSDARAVVENKASGDPARGGTAGVQPESRRRTGADMRCRTRWRLAFACLLALPGVAVAQTTPRAAQEIEQLIGRLEQSGCQFNRNGSWHDDKRAAAHLRRKYDYLRRRGAVSDAESFVELAASRSSLSGKPYRVRCGDAAPVDSNPWFRAELTRLREDPTEAAR